jgi:hypothetical protein
MIFQSTPGKLSEETILWVFPQNRVDFSYQEAVILKKFWIPMGIGVDEQACNPKPSISPTYATVRPKRKSIRF